eukprot:m.129901 g.129901  ORF g.129901 m.129901 type:complete len:162 (+) comp14586_c0_seq7:38-523(+)
MKEAKLIYKVDKRDKDKEIEPACVVRFTNGSIGNKLECEIFKERSKKILTAKTPRVSHTGTCGKSKSARYFVGVLNKEKRLLRICDANMFVMSASVKGDEKEAETKELNTPDQRKNARMQLTEVFGGKLKKRELAANERYRIDDDALVAMKARTVDAKNET